MLSRVSRGCPVTLGVSGASNPLCSEDIWDRPETAEVSSPEQTGSELSALQNSAPAVTPDELEKSH